MKNGGQVVSYRISQYGLKQLLFSGQVATKTGIHGTKGVINTEYLFEGTELVKYMNSIAKPIK